jgi:signal peptidase I
MSRAGLPGRRLAARGAVALALAVVVAIAAANVAGYRVVRVTSTSMQPTLGPGDRVLIREVDSATVQVGDLVLFAPSGRWRAEYERMTGETAGDYLVKRVVAVAGDTVECCAADGNLVRNGVRLDEPWLAEDPGGLNSATFRVTVPDASVWVLGDNRAISFDSRAMQAISNEGAVPTSAVSGVVVRTW